MKPWHAIAPVLLASFLLAGPGISGGASPRAVTLRECLEWALRENVEIALSREDREIARSAVPAEEAAFLPRFTAEISGSRTVSPSGTALTGDPSLEQREYRLDLGASRLFATGTTLSLDFRNLRQESNSAVFLLTPLYDTSLTLSARHPLLRDAGRESTEAPLRVARAGAEKSDAGFETRVMDIAASARNAFYLLEGSAREVAVRENAVLLAERLLARTRAQIDAGAAAPVDRLPAEAALAARREERIRAEALARNAEDDLRSLLGVPAAGDWERPLVAAGPAGPVEPPGPEDTFEEALRMRPEVKTLAAATRQAGIEEAAARNRVLPSLSLAATAGLAGLAGSPNPDPLFAGAAPDFEGNYGDSLDAMLSGKYSTLFLGLSTEIPWEFRKERADWAAARAALRRSRLAEEGLRRTMRTEVRKARRDLESAVARIDASAASAAAAEAALRAEERKLELGAATPIDVLRFQQEYAEALLAQVRATSDARLAQTRLWRAVGTILEKEGITLR